MWSVNDTANNVKPSKHNEQFSAVFSTAVFSTEDGKKEEVWKRPPKLFFELVGLNGKLKVHFLFLGFALLSLVCPLLPLVKYEYEENIS